MKASAPETAEVLRRAETALNAGDVVTARRLASSVLATHPGESDGARARELLARTDVAWPLLGYGVAAGVCFLLLVLLAVLRGAVA